MQKLISFSALLWLTVAGLTVAGLTVAGTAAAAVDARMLRQPDVSATDVVFVYAGDLWLVARDGGVARQLSTPAGEELFPRFSPDGRTIAFTGNYDGNADVYVVPTAGGVARRLTHHPAADRVSDWYPDGSGILYATQMTSGKERFNQLYKVSPQGGLPERLPVPYGEFGTIAADGRTLAYTPMTRDFRTWKRYRGGMAPEIWQFDLVDYSSRNLTADAANDGQPMWHGDALYFLSDRDANRRANLWVRSAAGEMRQLTHFEQYDVRFPAIGPDAIVFENGGRLYLFDLASEAAREVEVEVVTDLATLRPRVEPVAELIAGYDVAPSGKRALFEARGEVFTVPAEHGVVRNLTRSSGFAERSPAWSSDGREVAYWSDRSGEYELTVQPAEGGPEERLTSLGPGFRYRPFWSPDGRKIAFVDEAMRIRYFDRDRGRVVEVDAAYDLYEGDLRSFTFSWSPDSRWLAYHRTADASQRRAIFLYDTAAGTRHQVTSGYYSAAQPTFDPEGKYLYLLWARAFAPAYDSFQNSWIYANADLLAAVPLRADVPSPLAPRNDGEGEELEEAEDKDDERGDDGHEGARPPEPPPPVAIDLEGFESRIVPLPPAAGNYDRLAAVPGKLLYLRLPRTGAAAVDEEGEEEGEGAVVAYDLEEREEMTVVEKADDFVLAAWGETILVRHGEEYTLRELGEEPPHEEEEKPEPLAVAKLETTVDPAAEWRQIFNDVWRLERDYFYDPAMHGVDWPEMRQRYGALIADAVTRWDVNFVIGELIGELNVSHAYRSGGDVEDAKHRDVGLLGADYELANGFYRIAEIVDVAPWETEVRSPLRRPGVDVAEGDYLLAVNGAPLDPQRDPWAAFEGLAGETVALTVNDRPSFDGAREVLVETLKSEVRLRQLAWIEAKRRRVEEATDGRVGYVFVPDTGLNGQTELVRQFLAETEREGLIVDERFNNGGQIPDRFIEMLDRPTLNYWGVRHGRDMAWPPVAHRGPKAMLINGWSGSGGDLFPFYFRSAELGPLIGTRTWGGLVGISGNPSLIDGGEVTVPTFGIFSVGGEWIIEGHGVEPDVEVIDDPTALARGVDPQLERAIDEVMKQLAESPPKPTPKPAYPDRSGV